jgi:glycosyltransferase involved in cell wall biosynthesis
MSDAASPVTVFTITYDQRERLRALLEDLAGQDYPLSELEVVVLDDGSTDGTQGVLRQWRHDAPYRLVCLHRAHDGDYLNAQRWNECIEAASPRSQVLIQLDDVRVRPDLVSRHAQWHAHGASRPYVVTGAKFEGDVETWDLGSCARAHLGAPGGRARINTTWTAVWGASLSYPRALVEALRREPHERPFDERMTGWGFHEVEFAYRAARAGATIVYDPTVGVFHSNHTPTADGGRAIDHARLKQDGAAQNESYVLAKHGLRELPRW